MKDKTSSKVRTLLKAILVPPNSSRIYLERWIEQCAQTMPHKSFVLDAGSGDARYRYLFSHTNYESADFGKVDKHYADQTYTCDLKEIPVADARFDAILCSQVFEHLPYPAEVMQEFNRVLKPGGKLWISAPLFYEEHEQPYDFFRYTQYGLKQLIADSNFEVTNIDWMEGYMGTLSYQCLFAAKELPLTYLPARIIFTLAAHWFSRSDRHRRLTTSGMCKNYMVSAKKLA